MAIYEKIINETIGATKSVYSVIKEKRGADFKLVDCKPYVDAVNQMRPAEGQSSEVIDLHVQSVIAHYEVLLGLCETIRPEDDPFVEHYQTPPILEILYEEDPDFKDSMGKFIGAVSENKSLIGREAVRRYGGMYGLTCVVDFAYSCGSVPNLVNRILAGLEIPKEHKHTIVSAKSWGMNTSYGLGGAFRAALEAGKTAAEAEEAEVAQFMRIYSEPVEAQAELMDSHNLGGHGPHSSFDTRKYMAQYKEKMRPYVQAALKAGVHPANIVTVPAYCVGDIGHHIAQSAYNMFKDDMVFAVYEAVMGVFENTLKRGLIENAFKSPFEVLSVATGAPACAAAYILWKDSFTVPMVIDLLSKRFSNYAAMNPKRGEADELHNADFIDIMKRGERILDISPIGNGRKINGILVDLDPVDNHEVIANPQRYTYPACAITQRFAALMSLSDFPCYLTPEVATATLMTNIIALTPGQPGSPVRGCKDCAATTLIKRNSPMVTGEGAGAKGYCQFDVAI
ncbi:DUF2193 domain-containing protein [Dethiosulfatarculus sandiegensis]|uniref:DUF2193 domain-containing protein n=1 Tax=Dethiosulfatarculus sandiegensis TaxID=1429043 RepID=A0A0D2J7L8_9BACT|nr:DUF2193 domain-containing protein [Dethiosulfatarculus sandiegensis]KIX14209.1 hypothetical protein X474_09400 [Dethiosulfatarculus sandiegensis]